MVCRAAAIIAQRDIFQWLRNEDNVTLIKKTTQVNVL